MTESTENTIDFDIKVEDAGPARKRISVNVPSDVIDQQMSASMGTLQAQAQLPGFRKGKAPRHLLQRRFGSAIQEETIQKVLRESYEQAVSENKLAVLGDAEIIGGHENLKIDDGKPFTFDLEVEIVPEFDFPDFGSIEILRPQLDVNDEMIETEIERQCLRAGKAERIEEDFQPLDRMLGSIVVTASGEEAALFSHDQALVVLPEAGEKGQILGLLIDDLNASFKDAKVGDDVTIKAKGPDAHEQENFRGKDLVLTYKIHLCERIAPATIEELIEQFSLGTEDVLREQIVMALEQRRDEEQTSILRRQAMEKITEAIDFELPERASGMQMQRELDRMRHEMSTSGELTPDEVEVKLAEIRDDTEAGIQMRMKSYFILQRLAMHMETQVQESEINARIAAMAMQRGLRPDHVRSELAKAGQLPVIGSQVRDDKAADAMVAQMKIKDIPAEEWGEMVKQQPTGGTKKKASSKKTNTKKSSGKKAGTKKASSKKASTKKSASKKKT